MPIGNRAQSETHDFGDLMGCRVRSEDPNELRRDGAFAPFLEMAPEGLGNCFARLRGPGIHGLFGVGLEFERGMLDLKAAEWWLLFPHA